MNINVKATNLEMTEAIRGYIEEKVASLDKYLGDLKVVNCDFEIELTTNHHHKGDIFKAEINLAVPGELLRVEKIEDDLYKAIDKVKDHVVDVIVRHKERLVDKKRQIVE